MTARPLTYYSRWACPRCGTSQRTRPSTVVASTCPCTPRRLQSFQPRGEPEQVTIGPDAHTTAGVGADATGATGARAEVDGHPLVGAPSPTLAAQAERHATDIAAAIGCQPPKVHWYRHSPGAPLGLSASHQPDNIYLNETLTADELRYVIAHETCHAWQWDNCPELTTDEAEAAADAFARQMTANNQTPNRRRRVTLSERRAVADEIRARHTAWRRGTHPAPAYG